MLSRAHSMLSFLGGLFLFAHLAQGAEVGIYEYGEAKGMGYGDRLRNAVQAEVGKQYWASNHKLKFFCDQTAFPQIHSPRPIIPTSCPGLSFSVNVPARFTIEAEKSMSNLEHTWFFIRFESGKTAYLNGSILWSYRYNENEHGPGGNNPRYPSTELVFFEEHPDIVFERRRVAFAEQDKKRELERLGEERKEKERLARGGVRVGMTKAQVTRSNWGEPESINTTIVGRITTEQWVYGLGEYLYFKNGRLSAIQTSQ